MGFIEVIKNMIIGDSLITLEIKTFKKEGILNVLNHHGSHITPGDGQWQPPPVSQSAGLQVALPAFPASQQLRIASALRFL